jgi:hypothetical protein
VTEPDPYLRLIAARTSATAATWLTDRLAALDAASLVAVHAGAGRRLGAEAVQLSESERESVLTAGLLDPSGWPLSRVARVLIVRELCRRTPAESHVGLVERLFKRGDNAERAALLQGLCLLPAAERFAPVAIDACRSHVADVFEAIACENPYPARYFPDESFNQMVLKAFFTGVAVKRVHGLADRRGPDLKRMAEAYASERRAAGRSVPADLHLATGERET